MSRKQQISLVERRAIQLKMLEEIDLFCRNNNIRYSLAYGTLIGAIRHKGFIPWDDDVDLIMPLSDIERFKSQFKSENILFCDVDTVVHYDLPFPRLASKGTYQKNGLISKSYGVNIDLYVMVSLPNSETEINAFFTKANGLLQHRRRLKFIRKYLLYFLPINTIPGFSACMKEYRDLLLYSYQYNEKGLFFAVSGMPEWKEVYDFNIFDQLIDVEFEGLRLLSTARYDQWLTKEYGDYMTLPPEEQRQPYHGGKYYYK